MLCFTAYNSVRWWKFQESSSTCIGCLKCATSLNRERFVNVVQKAMYRAEGQQFHLFEFHFENRTPIARVDVFEGCNFADNGRKLTGGQSEKSANSRPELHPYWGYAYSIHNYSFGYASFFAFPWLDAFHRCPLFFLLEKRHFNFFIIQSRV